MTERNGPDWIILMPGDVRPEAIQALNDAWDTARVVILPVGSEIRSARPEAVIQPAPRWRSRSILDYFDTGVLPFTGGILFGLLLGVVLAAMGGAA